MKQLENGNVLIAVNNFLDLKKIIDMHPDDKITVVTFDKKY